MNSHGSKGTHTHTSVGSALPPSPCQAATLGTVPRGPRKCSLVSGLFLGNAGRVVAGVESEAVAAGALEPTVGVGANL